MNYVALDTASGTLKVLVKYGDDYEYYSDVSFKSASEKMMPELDRALEAAGASLSDMDYFGCVTGPGSFTGIRIGMAAVKAFAYAFGKPVLPVNSLELLAACRPFDTTIAVADAGNGMRYVAVYDEKGGETMPPRALKAGELKEFLSMVDEPHAVVADAAAGEGLEDAVVPDDLKEAFARLMETHTDRLTDGNLVEPLYVRKPQAVLDLEKRNGND